jgi:hypothetical protein
MNRRKHLGQILIHLKVIDHRQVIEAREKQMREQPAKPIGQVLRDLEYITDDDLRRALALQQTGNG